MNEWINKWVNERGLLCPGHGCSRSIESPGKTDHEAGVHPGGQSINYKASYTHAHLGAI